jgi:hypothetical protein
MLISFLQIYGLFCLFATILFILYLVKNYVLHKKLFFSIKDIETDYQLKQIENIKKQNESLQNELLKVQQENDELSKIIIKKIR